MLAGIQGVRGLRLVDCLDLFPEKGEVHLGFEGMREVLEVAELALELISFAEHYRKRKG